jgi:hypothetical protein
MNAIKPPRADDFVTAEKSLKTPKPIVATAAIIA